MLTTLSERSNTQRTLTNCQQSDQSSRSLRRPCAEAAWRGQMPRFLARTPGSGFVWEKCPETNNRRRTGPGWTCSRAMQTRARPAGGGPQGPRTGTPSPAGVLKLKRGPWEPDAREPSADHLSFLMLDGLLGRRVTVPERGRSLELLGQGAFAPLAKSGRVVRTTVLDGDRAGSDRRARRGAGGAGPRDSPAPSGAAERACGDPEGSGSAPRSPTRSGSRNVCSSACGSSPSFGDGTARRAPFCRFVSRTRRLPTSLALGARPSRWRCETSPSGARSGGANPGSGSCSGTHRRSWPRPVVASGDY